MLRKISDRRNSDTIEESAASSPGFKLLLSVFAGLMIIVYVGIGLYLIFNPTLLKNALAPELHYLLGGLLILYGGFRGYRTFLSAGLFS